MPDDPTRSRSEEELIAELDAIEQRLRAKLEAIDRGAAERNASSRFEEADHTKLADIERRASEARNRAATAGAIPDKDKKSESEDYRGLGFGLAVAYAIIGFPLLGAAIGWFVDRGTGAKVWVGYCALIGTFMGVGVAIWMLAGQNKGK